MLERLILINSKISSKTLTLPYTSWIRLRLSGSSIGALTLESMLRTSVPFLFIWLSNSLKLVNINFRESFILFASSKLLVYECVFVLMSLSFPEIVHIELFVKDDLSWVERGGAMVPDGWKKPGYYAWNREGGLFGKTHSDFLSQALSRRHSSWWYLCALLSSSSIIIRKAYKFILRGFHRFFEGN